MESCSNCNHQIVDGTYLCPSCDDLLIPIEDTWLALSTASETEDAESDEMAVANHNLVPEHQLISKSEVQEVFNEFNIDRSQLPQIRIDDPAIETLPVRNGDIIKIIRESRTTETARVFRLVTPLDDDTDDHSEWEEQTDLPSTIYKGIDSDNEDLLRHILNNLGASIPPTEPGACEQIAVNREEEIEQAIQNVESGVPYTFIEGELGFGKSFFVYWLRDRLASHTAVSIIDLDEDTVFSDPASVVQTFRSNLQTPRSLETDQFANGVDELWATFLYTIEHEVLNYLEERGFELTTDRVEPNILSALTSLLSILEIPTSIKEKLVEIGEANLQGEGQRSFSKEFPDTDITSENAYATLTLFSELARFSGYRLVLAVDELEKAERTEEHFKAISEFIENLPENTCLFVTGTPELLEGGSEDVAMRETFEPLYEKSSEHLISLDQPSNDDLVEFTENIMQAEEAVLSGSTTDKQYTERVSDLGGTASTVDTFVEEENPTTLTFREYIQYLRD